MAKKNDYAIAVGVPVSDGNIELFGKAWSERHPDDDPVAVLGRRLATHGCTLGELDKNSVWDLDGGYEFVLGDAYRHIIVVPTESDTLCDPVGSAARITGRIKTSLRDVFSSLGMTDENVYPVIAKIAK